MLLLVCVYAVFITKIKHGLLLVTLLVLIDFFLVLLLVAGIHGAQALGIHFSLIDAHTSNCLVQQTLFPGQTQTNQTECDIIVGSRLGVSERRSVWHFGALVFALLLSVIHTYLHGDKSCCQTRRTKAGPLQNGGKARVEAGTDMQK
eukprot:scaffold249197_cov16-Tisochrysis_lutea.AAC.1